MIIRLGGWTKNEDRVFEGEETEGLKDFQDPLIRILSPIRYRLTAHLAADELIVRGQLEVTVSARCARCGEWSETVLREPSFMRCVHVRALNDVINLTEDVREDTLLIFPANFLCSASCKGMCPVCGANLNQAPCSCPPYGDHDGWHALDMLRQPDRKADRRMPEKRGKNGGSEKKSV